MGSLEWKKMTAMRNASTMLLLAMILAMCVAMPTFADQDNMEAQMAEELIWTKFPTSLLPGPNSQQTILTIPPGVPLRVEGRGNFQQYRYVNTWYKVTYMGQTGWVSGWNMTETEELRPVNVTKMYQRYSIEYGPTPTANELGVIPAIDRWIKNRTQHPEDVTYLAWHAPVPLAGYWAVRVQYRERKFYGGFETLDKVFGIKHGKVVDVKNPWDL